MHTRACVWLLSYTPLLDDRVCLRMHVYAHVIGYDGMHGSHYAYRPGRVAQSIGHMPYKSKVLGSIPDLATYFRFSFR